MTSDSGIKNRYALFDNPTFVFDISHCFSKGEGYYACHSQALQYDLSTEVSILAIDVRKIPKDGNNKNRFHRGESETVSYLVCYWHISRLCPAQRLVTFFI